MAAAAEEVPVVLLSLHEWRETDPRTTNIRTPWDPLIPWFENRGLTLFTTLVFLAIAPDRVPRTFDGIGYASWKGSISWAHGHHKAIHCFARDSFGHDVLIRLIKKGEDGKEELDILQHVCTGHDAFLGENHCLPMLRLLSVGDMTFGVFPAVFEGFGVPWFTNVDELLDAVLQLLEGLEYLHRNLIAHRDIGAENILVNFIGGPRPQTPESSFRKTFPIRYYYIDFELSVRFPPESKPEDRVVSGIPLLRRGYDHPDDYGRDLAPEIIGDNPHDPFKADVYQLGMMFLEHFKQLRNIVPELIEMFDSMTRRDPLQRPTAHQLLEVVRDYEASLTREQLRQSAGEEPVIMGISDSERDRRYKAMLERKAARKQAKAIEGASIEDVSSPPPDTPSPAEDVLPVPSLLSTSAVDAHDKSQSKSEPFSPVRSLNTSSPDSVTDAATPPPMKADLAPAGGEQKSIATSRLFITTGKIACFVLHLSLSFAFWCIILGPFRISSSLSKPFYAFAR